VKRKSVTPEQIEDVKLLVRTICDGNEVMYVNFDSEAVVAFKSQQQWEKAHDAALRLRALWKKVKR